MADKASDGFPYGQLGRAIYDAENGEWAFARSAESCAFIQPVGGSQLITKPTLRPDEQHSRSGGKDAPGRRREKQAKALVHAHPEFQPIADFLPELARVSEAVEDAAAQHDPSTGQLIAVGKIYDESRRDYVDAMAFPCGPTGSDLRIIQGLRQRQGWDADGTTWIETSDFTGESVTWEGPGVAILSVDFAHPLEHGERYLAIRLHTETLIFRPVIKKQSGPGSSRLEPNLLFSIGMEETAGSPHMHVAFNPWFTGQFVIVDQAGSWSVWEAGRKSSKAKMIKSGAAQHDTRQKDRGALDDGWARAIWVEGTSTLCVANRRKLELIDLEANDELSPTAVDVGLNKVSGWILDVAALQSFFNNLFVVTSHHILVYRMERAVDGQVVQILVSQLRHHRNPEDVSLRGALTNFSEDVNLILRSALNPTIDQYCFNLGREVVNVRPPVAFELPANAPATDILDVCLVHVTFIGKTEVAAGSPDSSAVCYLYLLNKELALSRTLYTFKSGRHPDRLRTRPTWTSLVTKPRKKSKPVLGGFVVEGASDTSRLCKRPTSAYVQQRRNRSISRSGPEWTINLERIARQVNSQLDFDCTDIDEAIEEVAALLREPVQHLKEPMRSLYEVVGGSIDVNDIESASARLAGLSVLQPEKQLIEAEEEDLDHGSQAQRLTVSTLLPGPSVHLLGLDSLSSLMAVVETLKETWDSDVTARAELIKRVAAEITLAGHGLRFEEGEPKETKESQSQAWDLPVRLPPGEYLAQASHSHAALPISRSQTPVLPTPSASVSTITGSSRPADFAAPEIARLSKYTTFTTDPPPALPRTLNRVLSHWTLGSDPFDYDWQRTARHVSRRNEDADADALTERERRQMQRRAERYMRRQRREAEESQRMQMLSSQAPEIVSASQPGAARAESQVEAGAAAAAAAGSSQSYGLGPMAASQVVPGRHGGRQPPRKKRKSGF